MNDAFHEVLSGWANFYVIVGAASGALTGLMFVVITLIGGQGTSSNQISAFGTPTIVHFVAPLLLAAIIAAPWPTLAGLGLTLKLLAGTGFLYAIVTLRLATKQYEYLPTLDDWIWFWIVPLLGYAVLVIAALVIDQHLVTSLFMVAGVALLLLLVAVRNAWDTVTYIAIARREVGPESPKGQAEKKPSG